MTDEQIIKALECCANDGCRNCTFDGCTGMLLDEGVALDLISRQKAEIAKKDKLLEIADKMVESLKAEVKRLKFRKCLYSGLYSEYDIKLIRDCTQGECFHRESEEVVRLDAIKEILSKLKDITSYQWKLNKYVGEFKVDDFDNLVKEMVGDDNA